MVYQVGVVPGPRLPCPVYCPGPRLPCPAHCTAGTNTCTGAPAGRHRLGSDAFLSLGTSSLRNNSAQSGHLSSQVLPGVTTRARVKNWMCLDSAASNTVSCRPELDCGGRSLITRFTVGRSEERREKTPFATFADFSHATRAGRLRITLCAAS